MKECGEAPEAACLGILAVPPLVTSGGAVAFVLFALPQAEIHRPVHACNISIVHVFCRLQLQHEHSDRVLSFFADL